MGKYSIVIEKAAQKELQALYKSGDKASIKRIETIFEELSEHPENGTGVFTELCQLKKPLLLLGC